MENTTQSRTSSIHSSGDEKPMEDVVSENIVVTLVPNTATHNWIRNGVKDQFLTWTRPTNIVNSLNLFSEECKGIYRLKPAIRFDELFELVRKVEQSARSIRASTNRETFGLRHMYLYIMGWIILCCTCIIIACIYGDVPILCRAFAILQAYVSYIFFTRNKDLILSKTVLAMTTTMIFVPNLSMIDLVIGSVVYCVLLLFYTLYQFASSTVSIQSQFAKECTECIHKIRETLEVEVMPVHYDSCTVTAPWKHRHMIDFRNQLKTIIRPHLRDLYTTLRQQCFKGAKDALEFMCDPSKGMQYPFEDTLTKIGFAVNPKLEQVSISYVTSITPQVDMCDNNTDYRIFVHPDSQHLWNLFWAANALVRLRYNLTQLIHV